MSIGWQFFYEGTWKYKTQLSANPWTSAGYLKGAQGPLREFFRGLVEDPDDLDKLDYEKVVANWEQWTANFQTHFNLDEAQKKRLNTLLEESKAKLHEILVEDPVWAGEKLKG